MIFVYNVWLIFGPPSRFGALIRKQEMWLLYKTIIDISRTLLSAQRKTQETQKNRLDFFFENPL